MTSRILPDKLVSFAKKLCVHNGFGNYVFIWISSILGVITALSFANHFLNFWSHSLQIQIITLISLSILFAGGIYVLIFKISLKRLDEFTHGSSLVWGYSVWLPVLILTIVFITTNPLNIAKGSLATQSSSILHGDAANAIDGITNGNLADNSVSHTDTNKNAWWQVDIGSPHALSEIHIWNRTDCCGERLSNFYVLVSDEPFTSSDLSETLNQKGVGSYFYSGIAGSSTNITINRTGRFVRIQLSGNDSLSMAEVEIFSGFLPEPVRMASDFIAFSLVILMLLSLVISIRPNLLEKAKNYLLNNIGMNKIFHSRFSELAIPVLIFSIIIITYWRGRIAIPFMDDYITFYERSLVKTNWEWFWHLVFFSRTRFTNPGDYFLFRPAMFGTMALTDIIFSPNLFAMGWVSFVFLGLSAFCLYLYNRSILNGYFAFILSIFVVTQINGIDIILWRSISSYIISIGLLILGAYYLYRYQNSKRRALIVVPLFLFAALFHEVAMGAFIAVLIIMLILNWISRKEMEHKQERRQLVLMILIPLAIYWILNLIDLVIHTPPSFLGSGDTNRSIHLLSMIKTLFYSFGLVASSVLFVFKRDNTSPYLTIYSLAASIVILPMVLFIYYDAIKSYIKGNKLAFQTGSLVLVSSFIVLILGIGLGRGYLRSLWYVSSRTYYYSMFAFLLCVLIGLTFSKLRDYMEPHNWTIARNWVCFLCFITIIINFVEIQNYLTNTKYQKDWKTADSLLEIKNSLKNLGGYCLSGVDPNLEWSSDFKLYVNRDRCLSQENKIPLLLTRDQKGDLWWEKIIIPEVKGQELSLDDFDLHSNPVFSYNGEIRSDRTPPGNAGLLVSQKNFGICNISVSVEYPYFGGIITGYKDEKNYNIFVFDKTLGYVLLLRNGKIDKIINPNDMPNISTKNNHIEIIQNNNYKYFLINGNVINRLDENIDSVGKIGVLTMENSNYSQKFSNLLVDCHPDIDLTSFETLSKVIH